MNDEQMERIGEGISLIREALDKAEYELDHPDRDRTVNVKGLAMWVEEAEAEAHALAAELTAGHVEARA